MKRIISITKKLRIFFTGDQDVKAKTLTFGTGNSFRQDIMDPVYKMTIFQAFREIAPVDTIFARTFG